MTKGISELSLTLSEAQLKKTLTDYLEIGQAQGRWLYLRLNSGELIAVAGDTRRRIKLCPPGTADFVVFQGVGYYLTHYGQPFSDCKSTSGCRVTFIECKSSKGKTSKEQDAFAEEVKKQNCRYFVIRDADEIAEVLK